MSDVTGSPRGMAQRWSGDAETPRVGRIAWSPDGSSIAVVARNHIALWDAAGKSPRQILPPGESPIWDVSWSPDGSRLAISRGSELVIVNVTTGLQSPKWRAHDANVYCVAWSPDGAFCASGSEDGTVKLWEPTSRWRPSKVLKHKSSVYSLAWMPDGTMLGSGAKDTSIVIWVRETGEVERLLGHESSVFSLAWFPGRAVLASASADKTIRIWDVRKAETIAKIDGHSAVYSVAFPPDGKVLASKSADNTIRFWSSTDWHQLAAIDQPASESDGYWPAGPQFDPTGRYFAALGESDRDLAVSTLDTTTLYSSTDYPRLTYAFANVVLVGDARVGKSAIAQALAGRSFQETHPTNSRSVISLGSEEVQVGGARQIREVLLWDLGGHPKYRLLHHLGLHDADVAMLILDASSPDPGDWRQRASILRHTRRAGDRSLPVPILAVAARADDNVAHFASAEFKAATSALDIRGPFITSAKNGFGIASLREAIDRSIDWSAIQQFTPTESLTAIKTVLAEQKSQGRLMLDVNELYRATGREAEAPDARAAFEDNIRLLEFTGLIRILRSGGQVLLRPEILESYAAAILLTARQAPKGTGSISEKELLDGSLDIPATERIGDPGQERLICLSAIEELLAVKLAVRQSSEDAGLLILPSEVLRERGDIASERQSGFVCYRFAGEIERIYATLTASLAQDSRFRPINFWRYLAEYADSEGSTCGLWMREIGDHSAELILFSDASQDVRAAFEQFVRNHLEQNAVAQAIQRLRANSDPASGDQFREEAVPEGPTDEFHTLNPVSAAHREVPTDDATVLAKMRLQLEHHPELDKKRAVARTRLQQRMQAADFDVFVTYHAGDRRAVLELGNCLRQVGILPWIDAEQIRPGENWVKAKAEQYARAKSVTVVVGRNGLGDAESSEVDAFLREATVRPLPVIPVILPGTPRGSVLPSSLADFASVDFRLGDPNPLASLIWGITGDRAGLETVASTTRPQSRANDAQDLASRLRAAENRGDWAAAHSCFVEIARRQLVGGESQNVVESSLKALALADDPLKLDGAGLKEPLEILGHIRPDEIVAWLSQCHHREIALGHLRMIARSGDVQMRATVNDALTRVGIQPWQAWLDLADESAISGLPRSRGWPAARVRRFRLRQIKTFTESSYELLEEDGSVRPVSAFLGGNATGKSTLLQCLALCCLGSNVANKLESATPRTLLRDGAESGSIEVELELTVDPGATTPEKVTLCLGLGLDRMRRAFYPLPDARMSLSDKNHMEAWNLLRGRVGLHWGFCAGYGSSRALRDRGGVSTAPAEVDWVASLFQPQTSLLNPAVLDGILRADISDLSLNPSTLPLTVRDRILCVFQDMVPGLEIREQGGTPQLVEVHSGISSASALSDSYNSIIGTVAHLIRHILELTDWVRDPRSAEGIVLIDDIDLHLDSFWQSLILQRFARSFAKLQFIVTTRSPLVVGSVPDRVVAVLGGFDKGRPH